MKVGRWEWRRRQLPFSPTVPRLDNDLEVILRRGTLSLDICLVAEIDDSSRESLATNGDASNLLLPVGKPLGVLIGNRRRGRVAPIGYFKCECDSVDGFVARSKASCTDLVEHRVRHEDVVATVILEDDSKDRLFHRPVETNARFEHRAGPMRHRCAAHAVIRLEPGIEDLGCAVTPPASRQQWSLPDCLGLLVLEVVLTVRLGSRREGARPQRPPLARAALRCHRAARRSRDRG